MHNRRFLRVLFAALAALVAATMSFAGGAREKKAMDPPPMMSADAAAPEMADPAMGMELRSAPSTGMKVLFTDLMAAQAQAAKGPTVLFFAADWCPTCQAA